MQQTTPNQQLFTWQRKNGYEVSSVGDKRFSAFYATMPDNRTIEQWYQCDIKGYDPGGFNWKLGKGKPPLNASLDLYSEYLNLWLRWSDRHYFLLLELAEVSSVYNNRVLSDCFATTPVNQARALSDVLNRLFIG